MGKGYRSLSEKEKEQLKLVSNQLNAILPDKDIEIPTFPASPEAIKPGDLISFFYNGVLRTGLVVRSKKAPGGTFKSKSNNSLINVYSIDEGSLTGDTVQIIMNNLYRNRVACTYKYSTRILSFFFGSNNFRTFNLNNMSSITQIMITMDES
jgi:hypothetical protein